MTSIPSLFKRYLGLKKKAAIRAFKKEDEDFHILEGEDYVILSYIYGNIILRIENNVVVRVIID